MADETEQAISEYEIFLDWWKHADPDAEILIQARDRIAALRGISH